LDPNKVADIIEDDDDEKVKKVETKKEEIKKEETKKVVEKKEETKKVEEIKKKKEETKKLDTSKEEEYFQIIQEYLNENIITKGMYNKLRNQKIKSL
jgi:hypothetical protein